MPRLTLLFPLFSFLLALPWQARAQVYTFPENDWVDSVYESLSPEGRIAQLIMAAAYSSPEKDNETELQELLQRYPLGGVIFFKGSPQRQAEMQNRLQEQVSVPLWVGIDAEWGLNMRLDSTIKYPRQMALAAFDDDSLIYEMGREIGRQCKRLGIHVNFAPVADVNNNPNNPVINDRSFGEQKTVVARKALAYMRGLQDEGVIACIKHYPGHGDTETDSHQDLPVLKFPYERLDSLELYPFRYLIDSGAMSVMSAHLYISTLDPMPNQASSLSQRIIKYKLLDSLGFKGIVFTDALNMKGVSKYFKPGELEVRALLAGNDVLLFPENIPASIRKIREALDSCLLDSVAFEHSVKKVLAAKYVTGAWKKTRIDTQNLVQDLNNGHAKEILHEASARQLTLVEKEKKSIPLPQNKKIACVAIGDQSWNAFHRMMNNYGRYEFFGIDRDAGELAFRQLRDYLKQEDYDLVVVSLHNTNRLKSKMYGLSEKGVQLVKEVSRFSEVVLVSFGIPYNLQYFDEQDNILVAYQDIDINMEKAAMALHGAIPLEGRLPVTVDKNFEYGEGISQQADSSLLRYSLPEMRKLHSESFLRIDSAVQFALDKKIFPGCQVLVSLKGEVIYSKSFGFSDYSNNTPVQSSSLYDIASVTKVAATTLAVMHLYDDGKIDLNKKASHYLKELRKSNKEDITLRELLTHTAGLKSWIPFYIKTLTPQDYGTLYSSCRDEEYTIPIAANMYGHHSLEDSVWKWIRESERGKKGEYLYSDLSFYILQKVVEKVSRMPMNEYLEKHIYRPLALGNTAFRPTEKFPKSRIIPTENDTLFRQQLIQGFVHDPGAAMLGGVAGNAGLFSNANDLAVLMQVLLNGGQYNGKRLFREETITLFTAYALPGKARRGLGFDKPETDPNKGTPCSKCCSALSFGHSGFTGTYIWVDPQYELVYVFLSNRVHPDASNNQISKLNVRTNIQDMIYQILGVPCEINE